MYKTKAKGESVETTKTQLMDFLDKCEEVKSCKFIMATTKIKDLLKSIVNSAELYELFQTVATNFDYNEAKRKCFIEAQGAYGESRVALPDTMGERLAFIFCLLVEFDRNAINFNAFLQKYYPKDGSYYASYHLFCDEVIGSMQAIVCEVFAQELAEEVPALAAPESQPLIAAPSAASTAAAKPVASAPNPDAAACLNTVLMLIESEKEGVTGSKLGAEEQEAAVSMLNSIAEAVRDGNAPFIKSLTCGYNYFVMYTVFVSDSLSLLFEAIGEYLDTL